MKNRHALLSIASCAALLFLTSCRTAQTTLKGYGPASNSIAHISWLMTFLFLVLIVIMWALIAIAFTKRSGTLEEHAPIDTRGGEAWVAIGGLAVPLVVLTFLFVLGLGLLNAFPIHGDHHAGHSPSQMMKPDILVVGHQWWWEIHYLNDDPSQIVITANELHIPTDRPVNIEVETRDVMHSFWIPALHGKVDLIPGHPNYIRLEASQPGSYEGECAEFCGEQHAHMRLLAIAQPPTDYEAWLEAQRQSAREPTSADAKAGEMIFLAGPCSMCHQVRGTTAGGRVAPDLTHIGSRQYIAANSYPNNNAYLEAWVTHAQSLKSGAQMPNLTQFTGPQLQDLVAYLRQLK